MLLIAAVVIGSSLVVNTLTHASSRKTLEDRLQDDYAGTGDGYSATALSFIYNQSFSDAEHPYFGAVPSGPVYPLFVAAAFAIAGERLGAVWAFQLLFFIFAAILLWRIAFRMLPEPWALAASLCFAAFWGASTYVFQLNNEILSLTLILLFIYALGRYEERSDALSLLLTAFAFSLLVLLKPIFEPFLVISLGGIGLIAFRHSLSIQRIVRPALLFLVIALATVGAWHVRNYRLLGSVTISTGGHALYLRALSAIYPPATFQGFLVAAFTGDLIADKFVAGYADAPEPSTTIRRVFNRERMKEKRRGATEFELDERYWQEGKKIIAEHPWRYLAATPAWLSRLNSIPHYTGSMTDHLFVDTYTWAPTAVRILILLLLRSAWLMLMLVAIGKAVQILWHRRERMSVLLMAVLVLYVNGMYALFAHAEVRYLLPVMPFYILFAGCWLQRLIKMYAQRIRS